MKDGKFKPILRSRWIGISRPLAESLPIIWVIGATVPRQLCLLAEERSLVSRNATQITATDRGKMVDCLLKKWSPVQIAYQVGISYEPNYLHFFADKAAGGNLHQQLHCQKKRKKRYASDLGA